MTHSRQADRRARRNAVLADRKLKKADMPVALAPVTLPVAAPFAPVPATQLVVMQPAPALANAVRPGRPQWWQVSKNEFLLTAASLALLVASFAGYGPKLEDTPAMPEKDAKLTPKTISLSMPVADKAAKVTRAHDRAPAAHVSPVRHKTAHLTPAAVTDAAPETILPAAPTPAIASYDAVFLAQYKDAVAAFADSAHIRTVDAVFDYHGRSAIKLSRPDLRILLNAFDRVPDQFDTLSQPQINVLTTQMIVKSVKASRGVDAVTMDDINGFLNMDTPCVMPDGTPKTLQIGSILANAKSAHPVAIAIEDDIKESYAQASSSKLRDIKATPKRASNPYASLSSGASEPADQKRADERAIETARADLARLEAMEQRELQSTGDSMTVARPDGSQLRVMRSPMSAAELKTMPDIGPRDQKAEHYYKAIYAADAGVLGQALSYNMTAPIYSSDVIESFVTRHDRKGAQRFWNQVNDTHLSKKQAFREMARLHTQEQETRQGGLWTYFVGKARQVADQARAVSLTP